MRIGEDLPPLATSDDIVNRLGRSLNPVEAARIGHADDEPPFSAATWQDSSEEGATEIVADAGEGRLSNRPVPGQAVTWVRAVSLPETWGFRGTYRWN